MALIPLQTTGVTKAYQRSDHVAPAFEHAQTTQSTSYAFRVIRTGQGGFDPLFRGRRQRRQTCSIIIFCKTPISDFRKSEAFGPEDKTLPRYESLKNDKRYYQAE